MSRGIKRSLIALSVSTALFAPSVFATNGYFSHGYGTKEKGMAGAGVAYSTDALAVANNPAGIAGMGERMDIGAALFSPPRSYTASGAPSNQFGPGGPTFSLDPGKVDSNLDMFLIPHFAYNWQLDNESSVAFGMYANGGMNSNYKGGSATTAFDGANFSSSPGTFGAGTTGIDLKQLFLNLSYATKLNKDNSIGASLIFAYQLFEAKGLAFFGGAGFSESPASLTGNDAESSTGFGVKLGWQGNVSNQLTLGASYQSKMSMGELDDYAGLFAEQGGFDIPATASLGMAWHIDDKSTFVLDVQTIFFGDVPSLNNPISQLFAPPVGNRFGSTNGPGFGWDDMTIIKLGYEWYTGDTAYRVGISNGNQPIPSSEVLFNLLAPAVIETHITAGFTTPVSSSSEFSFAAMYGLKNSVIGPNPFDPGQTIEIEMYQYEFQATYSMMF